VERHNCNAYHQFSREITGAACGFVAQLVSAKVWSIFNTIKVYCLAVMGFFSSFSGVANTLAVWWKKHLSWLTEIAGIWITLKHCRLLLY